MVITPAQREAIREAAGDCCEYCRVAQADRLSRFQIDHIIPIKHGGRDDTDNLCLACLKCNGYKGPNVAALDPATGEATKLYNPRQQVWDDHVRIDSDATLTGRSPSNTVSNLNSAVKFRRFLLMVSGLPVVMILHY